MYLYKTVQKKFFIFKLKELHIEYSPEDQFDIWNSKCVSEFHVIFLHLFFRYFKSCLWNWRTIASKIWIFYDFECLHSFCESNLILILEKICYSQKTKLNENFSKYHKLRYCEVECLIEFVVTEQFRNFTINLIFVEKIRVF